MFRVNKLIFAAILALTAATAFAGEEHGLSQAPDVLPHSFSSALHLESLHLTNSLITSWIVSIVLILVVRLVIGRPKLIPSRGQAIMENMISLVRDVTDPVVGAKVARYTFPLLISLFTYILIQNWSSLLPGVGTVMISHTDAATGVAHWVPFVRAGNADLNATLALATVGIVAWIYFIFRYAGVKHIIKDIFGNKASKHDVNPVMYNILFVVFLAIGVIELVSMAFRPVSLSFRLFGNAFGGEYIIHTMSAITRWGLPVPFYFLEFLVGIIQALVFMLLISVYIGLMCNHQGGDHHEEHADDKEAAH